MENPNPLTLTRQQLYWSKPANDAARDLPHSRIHIARESPQN